MPLRKPPVIFIVGPTAIGKTAAGIKLAKRINGEIISCDSMQVYKGLEALSQAPAAKETKNVRYHLISFLDPQDDFSVAKFIDKAASLIDDILRRKKVPILIGGSGLYVKALIDGLFPSPKEDEKFRKKMYKLAERYGSKYLYNKLNKVDPASASAIHQNDIRRIVRALEIWHGTGKTMSELKRGTKGIASIYKVKIFGLTAPREHIYSNINNRVEDMVRAGALREVKKIYRRKLSRTASAMIGLNELSGFLKGKYDIEAAKELMKMNTRRFAKRQLTWFRADKRIKWFDMNGTSQAKMINEIAAAISSSLKLRRTSRASQ